MSDSIDNDIVPSWADLRLLMDGKEIVGFKSISFGDKLEDEMVYGASRTPLGRTRGKYMTEDGTISVFHNTMIEIIELFGDGWADRRFDFVEQIALANGQYSTTVVEQCRLKGAPGGGEEGTSAFTRDLPYSFMRIKRNGLYLVAQTRR